MKNFFETIFFQIFFILLILFTLIPLFFILPIPVAPNFSKGEYTGDVYNVAEKGLFFKSLEGEMYLGTLEDEDGKLRFDKFKFSLPKNEFGIKKELIDKLKICVKRKTMCTISYQKWLNNPITIKTNYVVIGVEVHEQVNPLNNSL